MHTVSGFISLARVSTSSGMNWSDSALHSLAISLIGMKGHTKPSNTSPAAPPGSHWIRTVSLASPTSPCKSCRPRHRPENPVSFSHTALIQCFIALHLLAWGCWRTSGGPQLHCAAPAWGSSQSRHRQGHSPQSAQTSRRRGLRLS